MTDLTTMFWAVFIDLIVTELQFLRFADAIISPINHYVPPTLEEDTTLDCPLPSTAELLMWITPHHHRIIHQKQILHEIENSKQKYAIFQNGTLKITSINENDAGIYSCVYWRIGEQGVPILDSAQTEIPSITSRPNYVTKFAIAIGAVAVFLLIILAVLLVYTFRWRKHLTEEAMEAAADAAAGEEGVVMETTKDETSHKGSSISISSVKYGPAARLASDTEVQKSRNSAHDKQRRKTLAEIQLQKERPKDDEDFAEMMRRRESLLRNSALMPPREYAETLRAASPKVLNDLHIANSLLNPAKAKPKHHQRRVSIIDPTTGVVETTDSPAPDLRVVKTKLRSPPPEQKSAAGSFRYASTRKAKSPADDHKAGILNNLQPSDSCLAHNHNNNRDFAIYKISKFDTLC